MAPKKAGKKFRRRYRLLNDPFIQSEADFRASAPYGDPHEEPDDGFVWDNRAPGLRVNFGRRKVSWSYFKQVRIHGKRQTISVVLGTWPLMKVKAARDAALIEAGRVAAKRIRPGKRAAVKFGEAFEEYIKAAEAKAERKGKPARWAKNARLIGSSLLLPEFARFPLADLSASPAIVRDFHKRITRDNGPVQANRAMAVLRATYRNAAKLNRDLPPALPTSAVVWNTEKPAEKGVFDFHEWAAAWRAIPSATKRGFHLANLLTSCRPGELARAVLDTKRRELVIPKSKSGRDLHIPLSIPIARALKMAKGGNWAAARLNPVRDGLPAFGHALRHAGTSVAVALGIDPLLRKMLLGHSLGSDVTEGYASSEMLRKPLREAQRKISAEIVRRLAL
jgi:hypothetical protein